jgi:hypothetical protein
MAITGLTNLCAPASLYLVLSIVALILMAFQNIGNNDIYCLGSYTCNVSSIYLIFIIKVLYVLFFKFVLNLICKEGAPGLSWFLVLLPFVLLFILLAAFLFSK